ncbi:Putative 37S ribosomal protein S4-like protein, partial [Leucoagaricus sp. SymC.cos]
APQNLYNLWQRTVGPKSEAIKLRDTGAKTLFQIFKRWYLPETIPDVRPHRAVKTGDDEESLAEYARRKRRTEESEKLISRKGMLPVGSLMFSEVERRIDTVIFWACFAESIYEARKSVVHGDVLLNGKKHTNANTRLAPGDMVSVNPSAIRFLKPQALPDKEYEDVNGYLKLPNPDPNHETPFFLPHYASPHLFIPAYIEPSFSTCSAIYVRHPTARPGYSEIPTPYDADGAVVRYAWEWYVKSRPRIRSMSRLSRMPEDRALKLGISDREAAIKEGRRKLREDVQKIVALKRE